MVSGLRYGAAIVLTVLYGFMTTVAAIGFLQIWTHYYRKKSLVPSELEPVTILRPIKGIDPELYSCLESSFRQNYPPEKLEIIFCIDQSDDPSIPIVESLIRQYPQADAKILLSEGPDHFGPNPKVNNLSKGFRAAKHDVLWIMDSNVWASQNVLMNSIKSLNENLVNGCCRSHDARRVKLVHHVPLALALSAESDPFAQKIGIKLDEMFLMSSHSKFYVGLNKLSVAACVNGKSNLYRRSDLDAAVASIPLHNNPFFSDPLIKKSAQDKGPGQSIQFFAKYIGEDNMIAISLWEFLFSRTSLTSDVVVQPLTANDGIKDFMNRRVRWLRVRKYMVYMATLVEPATESLVCGIYGTFALSTVFWGAWFRWSYFFLHMAVWYLTDWVQYNILFDNIRQDRGYKPEWIRSNTKDKNWGSWTVVWVLRELLALPIWITAMCGHEIDWRGRPFKINKDLTAEEL